MRKITIRTYNETDFEAWNKLVSESKNGTFLFDRNFMDYHKHKFQDFSLMIYNEKTNLLLLCPLTE
jgi:hypothetical protein